MQSQTQVNINFIKGVKNTKWNVYYVVDHKERIKDISISLLRELNLDKADVVGKKLFSVFGTKNSLYQTKW